MDEILIFFSAFTLTYFIICMYVGLNFDEQFYRTKFEKHTTSLPKLFKFIFAFTEKKNRTRFIKAAAIQQLFAYILLLIYCVVVIFNFLGFYPNNSTILWIVYVTCGIQAVYTVVLVFLGRILSSKSYTDDCR